MAEPTSKLYSNFPMIKYRFTGTIDPASLLTLVQDTIVSVTTPTAAGVAVGDICLISTTADLLGTLLHAYVSAANTVKIVVTNIDGSTADVATGTYTVLVIDGNSGKSSPF